MATPIPEHQSIFGDTHNGVPSPNIPHCHPYPTRYHGPIYNIPVFGKPYRQQTWTGGYGPLTGLGGTGPCENGMVYDEIAGECRPYQDISDAQANCTIDGGRFTADGQCHYQCPGGYWAPEGACLEDTMPMQCKDGTWALPGKCPEHAGIVVDEVFVTGTRPVGGSGSGGGSSSFAVAKAGVLNNKTLLIGVAVVAGVAALAMLAKPKRATPNAREKLPKAYSQYGASMGRPSSGTLTGARIHLRRVPIDRDGYDNGGAYWGTGEPLWHASGPDGEQFFRASDRAAAKAKLPGSRFFK